MNDHPTSTLPWQWPWQWRLGALLPTAQLRRVAPETWLCALVAGVAVFYGVRAAWYFFAMNAPLHFDDGYVTAVGVRLLEGHGLPYVDAASHRGPVMYWLAALAQALGGRMEWYGVRALASLAFLTSLLGVLGAALYVRRVLVAAFGALSFVFINLFLLELQTVFGLVGEAMATPWLVAAFFCTTLALGRQPGEAQPLGRRCALLGAAGVLSALSGLTKQTYLVVVAPLALWALAATLSSEPEQAAASRLRRWASVGALVLGWLLPPLLVVLLYAAQGKLGTFYYWFYRYNVDVYMAPFADARVTRELYRWARDHGFLSFALVLLLSSVASQHVAPVLAAARGLPQAYARRGFELTIWLQALLALAIGFSTLRFWQQYFLPPVPWLALLIGLSLEQALGRNPHQLGVEGPPADTAPAEERRRVGFASLLAVTLGLGGFALVTLEQLLFSLGRERARGGFSDARPERLCDDIDRFAPAGEPLYIWGFDAEYYITCRRQPASRYVYSTLVSGSVPPDWGIHLEWSARGSIDALLDDLEATRPPLILDSPQRVHGVSMTQIQQLDHFLHDNYCNVGPFRSNDGRAMTGWQRRDLCPRPAAALAPR